MLSRSGTLRLTALAVLTLSLCVPFLVTGLPPILDYPNHLARAYILAFGPNDPVLSTIYAPHWAILPNLAIDLVLPSLARLMPLLLAGKLVLMASLLLPLLAGLLYSRALFGRWPVWGFGLALVTYNGVFMLGFMNFLIALALAFAMAALWLYGRESRPAPTVLAAALCAVAIFFCHIVGLALLFALIGAYEADRWLGPHRQRLSRRALPFMALFVLPTILFALSPAPAGHDPSFYLPGIAKLLFLEAPMMNYGLALDGGSVALVIGAVVLAIRRGWLSVPRQTGFAMAFLFLAYLVAPYHAHGGTFFDFRFAIMLGYLVFAGLAEGPAMPRRAGLTYMALGICLFGLRLGTLTDAWRAQDGIVSRMRQAMAPLTPGARVMVLGVTRDEAPDYWRSAPTVLTLAGLYTADTQVPVLLGTEKRAFMQWIFADPAQQPIRIREPYRSLTAPSFAMPSDRDLDTDNWAADLKPVFRDWPAHFDYVLVLNAGGMTDPSHYMADKLAPLTDTGVAALYKILR